MARQIHGVHGELLCEKRRQRSEILELCTNRVEEDQRWAITQLRVAEAELVRDPQKRRLNRDALAVLF
jgi:hypothetical protein